LAPREIEGVAINATLIRIHCLPLLAPRLLLAYLHHPAGRIGIEKLAVSGTAQMNLTVKALKTLPVPVPPLAEQQRLVALLEAADEAYVTAQNAAAVRHRIAQAAVFRCFTEGTTHA
jgi:type I restriction enzyme S subunit